MSGANLKKQIHEAVDTINDQSFLKAVYAILHDKVKGNEFEITDDMLAILDEHKKMYKIGKTKSYSFEEVKKYALTKVKK